MSRSNFKKLFDWRFDPKRVAFARRATKNKKYKKIVERHFLSYELGLDYDDEVLNAFYVLIGEKIGIYSRVLFNDIQETVELQSGFSGVSFRESKEETAKLLERRGYAYEHIREYVEDYENRLMQEYYEGQRKES